MSLMAAPASAHPGTAPGPIFDPVPCVVALDRDAQPSLQIDYALEGDYVQLTEGDIPLPDALTHQFFAFEGTILVRGFAPELHGFDASQDAGAPLPLWITQGDVERADHSSQASGLFYDLSPARADSAVLEENPAFQDRYRRITGDDARVSITLEQSLQGVRWDVSTTPTGVYTVAGYIFSPPYNGWEIRPGLVKISSAEHDPPAAVLDRVQEALFPGQGRRIGLCVDAVPGTRLRTYARLEAEGAAWQEWGDEASVESGTIERCFHAPDPAWIGAVRIRADLIDAEGVARSYYSPDVLTQLPGKSPCVASESICCEPARAAIDSDAGCDSTDASCSERSPAAGASADGERLDSSCAVRAGMVRSHAPGALTLLGLALLLGLTQRRRR